MGPNRDNLRPETFQKRAPIMVCQRIFHICRAPKVALDEMVIGGILGFKITQYRASSIPFEAETTGGVINILYTFLDVKSAIQC